MFGAQSRCAMALVAAAPLALHTGCSSNDALQTMPGSLDHFGDVLVMNREDGTNFRTLVIAGYSPSSCVFDNPGTSCFVSHACPNSMGASAGTVTITGKTAVMLAPASDQSYATQFLTDSLADAGQTIQVVASGAEVPPHRGTVTMPAAVQVTTPNGAQPIIIDRSRDLPVAWAASTASSMSAFLGVYESDGTVQGNVACSFDDTSGSGNIPAALLQTLPATTDGSSAFLTVGRYNWSSTQVGDWTISFGGASYVNESVTLE